MPMPIIPKPQYPNVPVAPGVPSVPRVGGIAQAQNTFVLATGDVAGILNLLLQQRWGLFTSDGFPAFEIAPGLAGLSAPLAGLVSVGLQILGAGGQSVGEMEFRGDELLTSAPQEQGAFVTYNKVQTPYTSRLTYIVSGTEGQRSAFIGQCEALKASLDLLTVVMPEYVYVNANVKHYDLRRTARRGVSMFLVDIWVEEVRITGTSRFSQTATKTPEGASPVNQGTVQPITPPDHLVPGPGHPA